MRKILILVFAVAVSTVGCSKKKGCTDPMSIQYSSDAEEDDGSCQYAGTGGTSTIAATIMHHTLLIPSKASWPDSAFVKFNAKDSPGLDPASYDMIVVGEVGESHVHIEGLKPGHYWVQCAAYDSTISERVTGGAAVTVSSNNQEVEQTIYVTE